MNAQISLEALGISFLLIAIFFWFNMLNTEDLREYEELKLAFNGSNLIILYDIQTGITNTPKAREHNVIVNCSGVG
jgi:hypothetical protein